MKKILVAILSILILNGCMQTDEYDVDHKAYQKCLEMEPYIDECVYNYVKYLPENIQKEME